MIYSPRHILIGLALLLEIVSFFSPVPLAIPLILVTIALLLP